MKKVKCTQAYALRPYVLHLDFSDGSMAILDMEDHLGRGVFHSLREYDLFRQIEIDRIGGAEWPNGASLAPEYLAGLPRSETISGQACAG